ncbi:hypothetical protein FACS1894151_04650 [Spirochaetia bacterium]|nr:hypothetical protein FACS1894151_04650 [Spirochaetia bacterium]
MFTYYASFAPGLQELTGDMIKKRLPDAVIQKLLDGAVVFTTDCSYDKLNLFCFNNIFAVIDIDQSRGITAEAHIKRVCTGSGRDSADEVIAKNNKKITSFRLVCSEENQPIAVSEKIRQIAEKYIARISGLSVNRLNPDTEFWFLYRSEEANESSGLNSHRSFSIFMKRLTRHQSWDKMLHAGELPPPFAYSLCALAELNHTDTVLDPFCGYGSIPYQALRHFPVQQFYAADKNAEAVDFTKDKLKGIDTKRFSVRRCAIESLIPENIALKNPAEHSISKIITDPPWGAYEQTAVPIGLFYKTMLAVFARLLKPDGTAIILTARNNELGDAVNAAAARQHNFNIQKMIPVLLSGKKAIITILKVTEPAL